MANQEFTVAQNIRSAPSSRNDHARVANQEFTVTQNIRRAPSSQTAHARSFIYLIALTVHMCPH